MKSRMKKMALAGAIALGVAFALAPQSGYAQNPDQTALREAMKVQDPAERVTALKKFLADRAESPLAPYAKQYIAYALADANAPLDQFTAAADDAIASFPENAAKLEMNSDAAEYLSGREDGAKKALEYAQRAKALLPTDQSSPEYTDVAGSVYRILGTCQEKLGQTSAALESLEMAAKLSPEEQKVLLALARTYEKTGQTDKAITYYIQAVGMFGGEDRTGDAQLRALYVKKNGSDKGLDEQIKAAHDASFNKIAFESRRSDLPAPELGLTSPDGKTVSLADFKGKIVVLDFWGSWCPPCRMELPIFQKIHEKYKDKGVVFLGVNWERADNEADHKKLATEFMAKNSYSFPVVFDFEKKAVGAYQLRGFPTVYVIDTAGKIRYTNLGFEPTVEEILEAQIQSLMAK